MLQLGLLVAIFKRYQIEGRAFLALATLVLAALPVHYLAPYRWKKPLFAGRLGGRSVLGVRHRGGSGGPGAGRPADRDLLPARLVGLPALAALPRWPLRLPPLRSQIALRRGPGHRLAGNRNHVHVSAPHLSV